MKPEFKPGRNIAIKVPAHEFEAMVHFYGTVLGLERIEASSGNDDSVVFAFGEKRLWIDKVEHISQAETWLEIFTDDVENAKAYLLEQGCQIRNEIEALPEGFNGFWLNSPANIIHLMTDE
jgi:predicted enzyme related to lactoylglutathione lyase